MLFNFYSERKEISLVDIQGNEAMPHLIIGCTLNDYQRVEDVSRHSDFIITSLHQGLNPTLALVLTLA